MKTSTAHAARCDCGGLTRVLDSRPTAKPLPGIRRRRQCVECGTRFSTMELRLDHLRLSYLVEYLLDSLTPGGDK
jgi:transcriptional regulator NrdR family protein